MLTSLTVLVMWTVMMLTGNNSKYCYSFSALSVPFRFCFSFLIFSFCFFFSCFIIILYSSFLLFLFVVVLSTLSLSPSPLLLPFFFSCSSLFSSSSLYPFLRSPLPPSLPANISVVTITTTTSLPPPPPPSKGSTLMLFYCLFSFLFYSYPFSILPNYFVTFAFSSFGVFYFESIYVIFFTSVTDAIVLFY